MCLCGTTLCPSCPKADTLTRWQEFLPAEIEYQSAFKTIIGVFEACTSSLADTRRGICITAECSGVGYNNVRPLSREMLRGLSALTVVLAGARGRCRCALSSSSPHCTLAATPCASSASCWSM